MKKYKQLLSNTLLFAIGNLGSKLVLFFLVPLYTHYLSKGHYGTIDLIETIVSITIPIISIVIFDAVLRFTLVETVSHQSVILNAFIIYAVGSCISFISLPLLYGYDRLLPWKWFVLSLVLIGMGNQISLTYIRVINTRLFVFLGLLQTLLLTLFNILFLVLLNWNVKGYLLATLLAQVIVFIIAFFKGKVFSDLREATFNKKLFLEMISYSFPLILNNISWWIVQSSDRIMVDIFIGSTALGLYAVAGKIPSLINVFTSIFSQAWTISSITEYESEQEVGFYSTTFSYMTFGVFTFCSILLIVIKPFMMLYVSPDFFESWRFVPFLLVSATFSTVSSFFGSIYGALKKSVQVTLSTLLSSILNIVLNLLLIPRLGVHGAVLATCVSYIFIAVYRMLNTQRYFSFKINYCKFLIESLAIILSAILVTYLEHGSIYAFLTMLIIFFVNIENIKNLYARISKTIICGLRR